MCRVSRSPSYLIRNGHSYCFRMNVPRDLQGIIRKKELRYSLGTGYLGTAKPKARLLAGQVQLLFHRLRRNQDRIMELPEDRIHEIAAAYLEKCKAVYDRPAMPTRDPIPFDDPSDCIESTGIVREDILREIATGDYWRVRDTAMSALKKTGLGIDGIDEASEAFAKVCRALLRAERKGLEYHLEVMRGNFADKLESTLDSVIAPISDSQPGTDRGGNPEQEDDVPKASGKLLSEVIAHHAEENRSSGTWSSKTESAVVPILTLFQEIVGDRPIKSIDRQVVSEYRDTLRKLPPNRSKDRRYRGKSVAELLSQIEGTSYKTVSETTIRNHISWVVALFNHAEAHGFIQHNPAARLKIARKTKKEKDYRAPFDQEDLKGLFQSEDYRSDNFTHSYMFWMPVLALFTGARLNELAQLHLDDIKSSQGASGGDAEGAGVWYLDINDDGPTKKLKNLASRRKVPLHPFIVKELNLPGRVEELRSKGHERLFPELRHGVNGYGKNVSRWFNEIYRAKVGITEDAQGRPKHFHSFRATFSTHLGQKRGIVDDKLLKQVLGHADDGSTTFSTYVEDFTPEQLLEGVILHIDYGIDLSHLKASKWVPSG